MMYMTQTQERPTKKVTTVNTKGQVAIPQALREKLDITPKTKLLVYGKDDQIIIEKIAPTDLEKKWGEIFALIDKKNLKLSEAEIQQEIDAYRAEEDKAEL